MVAETLEQRKTFLPCKALLRGIARHRWRKLEIKWEAGFARRLDPPKGGYRGDSSRFWFWLWYKGLIRFPISLLFQQDRVTPFSTVSPIFLITNHSTRVNHAPLIDAENPVPTQLRNQGLNLFLGRLHKPCNFRIARLAPSQNQETMVPPLVRCRKAQNVHPQAPRRQAARAHAGIAQPIRKVPARRNGPAHQEPLKMLTKKRDCDMREPYKTKLPVIPWGRGLRETGCNTAVPALQSIHCFEA
jgi:hypothetical protein